VGSLLKDPKLYIAPILAIVLLGLYVGTVWHMVDAVLGTTVGGETKPVPFDDGLIYVVTLIGSLVAALVISELAVTKLSGNGLGTLVFWNRVPNASDLAGLDLLRQWLTLLYILVWIGTGLSALVVGVLMHPDVSQTLSDVGTSWLGLAVGAVATYFGVKPSTRNNPDQASAKK